MKWLQTSIYSLVIPAIPWALVKYVAINPYIATMAGIIIGGSIYLFLLFKTKLLDITEIKSLVK
jgi:hypothetical protein